jgi:hypothetical protein
MMAITTSSSTSVKPRRPFSSLNLNINTPLSKRTEKHEKTIASEGNRRRISQEAHPQESSNETIK